MKAMNEKVKNPLKFSFSFRPYDTQHLTPTSTYNLILSIRTGDRAGKRHRNAANRQAGGGGQTDKTNLPSFPRSIVRDFRFRRGS